ncbi:MULTISPECIES: DUF4328 domain-containing protein [unclassified Streptomyces]|uniref:DUF4328 domain-containing protein n=1 Tax=unclassified Streptomyces TaxID=2593676 RepID=UPI00364AC3AB
MTSPHGPAWLRSPVGLGTAVALLIGLVIATDLFAVWADLRMRDVAASIADGDYSDSLQREAEDADSVYLAAGYAQTVSFLAAIVVYLVWFQRTRVNAEVFNPFGHSKKRAWTVWSWFVPVVSLWFPRRIMLDIWDASRPLTARGSHGLVNAWWTLWILALITDRFAFSRYSRAETPDEILAATDQVLLADVADIAVGVLAILVVLRLTRMQNEKAHQGRAPLPVNV